jgi:hypothetical protein
MRTWAQENAFTKARMKADLAVLEARVAIARAALDHPLTEIKEALERAQLQRLECDLAEIQDSVASFDADVARWEPRHTPLGVRLQHGGLDTLTYGGHLEIRGPGAALHALARKLESVCNGHYGHDEPVRGVGRVQIGDLEVVIVETETP